MFCLLLAFAPGFGVGFSVPTGQTGNLTRIGYWAEATGAGGIFSGSFVAEDFRSIGEGFYHASMFSLLGGVELTPARIFALGASLGPSYQRRSHDTSSEQGWGLATQANASLFYPGGPARVGVKGFARLYPGRESLLWSLGLGLFAGAIP